MACFIDWHAAPEEYRRTTSGMIVLKNILRADRAVTDSVKGKRKVTLRGNAARYPSAFVPIHMVFQNASSHFEMIMTVCEDAEMET